MTEKSTIVIIALLLGISGKVEYFDFVDVEGVRTILKIPLDDHFQHLILVNLHQLVRIK